MKYILLIPCMFPALVFGQTKTDYERTMSRFVKFYNAQQSDSIVGMWPVEDQANVKEMWSLENIKMMKREYGKIQNWKYAGIDNDDPNKVTVFRMQLSRAGEKATSFTLDKQRHLGTFRFVTSSDGIDKLLKKTK